MIHEKMSCRRILVIDDNHHIFRDFQTVLTDTPDTSELDALEADFFGEIIDASAKQITYELDYAPQGNDGVDKIKAALREGRPYALAFVDMRMPPGWDGLETITHIWKTDPSVQVVICTAYSDYSWDELKRQIGITDKVLILKKPFDPVEVAQLASSLTEKWALARQTTFKIGEINRIVNERTNQIQKANKRLHQEIADRKRTENALKESESRYKLLFEQANDAIYIIQDGIVTFANPGTTRILKLSQEQLMGKPFTDFIHCEDRDKVVNLYIKKLQGQDIPEQYYFRSTPAEGNELWLQNSAIRISWKDRPATLNITKDITRIKKREMQHIHSQKMEAMGTLAGGIAHDFNNILSAIMGYTQLSLIEASDNKSISHKLERVLQAGQRATELIDQILTFSRQDKKKKKPVSIRPVVAEVLKLLRASISTTIDFKLDIRKDTGAILAYPVQIHQILMNLCANAAHAMAENGGTLCISLSNQEIDREFAKKKSDLRPGPYVRLSVTDTGHGMDGNTIDKIFNPYFTTKKPGEGTGLGLSVVHGIIKDMQGVIEVSSIKGKGTSFLIYIPRVDVNPHQCVYNEKTPPTATERVLLVDDEEFVLDMTREMLERLGYNVKACLCSIKALHAFKENPDNYDLVITDQAMPKMTGEALTYKIHSIRSDIPVIICTGSNADIKDEKAIANEVCDFLKKPVLKNELYSKIRKVLDTSYSHRNKLLIR